MTEELFSRRGLGNLALLSATLLAVYLCWILILPFVAVITWAIALAVLSRPLYEFLHRRLNRPGLASAITVVLTGILLLGPGLLMMNQIAREAVEAANFFRRELETGKIKDLLERYPAIQSTVDEFIAGLDLGAAAGVVAKRASPILMGSGWFITQLFITLFSLFFLLRDSAQVLAALKGLLPLSDHEMESLLTLLTDTIYATIYGKFAAAGAQGVLGGLMFWWLGVPAPLLWGTVMAGAALVPMLGPAIIWVPAAILLAYQGAWIKAIIMAAWGVLAVGLIDNFVYPAVVGGRLQQHTLLTFFAAFGGLNAFGMSGLVLGPLILSLTLALIQVWRQRTEGGG